MQKLLSLLPRLWANWITLLGSTLTTISGFAILFMIATEIASPKENVYTNAFMVLALPVLFVLGLVIIPLGLYVDRRRVRAEKVKSPEDDPIQAAFFAAMSTPTARNRILFVAVLTIANVMLFSYAGNKSYTYMESPQFCGTTCHTVMQPEWTTYNGSKHSRVPCVECHIGPGASWAVRAKIDGLRQVWGVIAGDYHRPIPSPVEHLRPSRDTCEHCHWPEKFTGNRVRSYPHFKPDKDNTPGFNVAVLRVGGRNAKTGQYEGIHWHVSDKAQVRYQVLDAKRSLVGKITVLEDGKVVAEYEPPEKLKKMPVLGERTMDCVDCHNRPTHVLDPTPEAAVDRLMQAGLLDPKVPYMAKVATDVLGVQDVPRDQAESRFRKGLEEKFAAYPEVKSDPKMLDGAAKALAGAYQHNVFPDMKMGWGAYRNNIGHGGDPEKRPDDAPVIGCFRCHDEEHAKKLANGKIEPLSRDCSQCHEMLAADEDPAKLSGDVKAILSQ